MLGAASRSTVPPSSVGAHHQQCRRTTAGWSPSFGLVDVELQDAGLPAQPSDRGPAGPEAVAIVIAIFELASVSHSLLDYLLGFESLGKRWQGGLTGFVSVFLTIGMVLPLVWLGSWAWPTSTPDHCHRRE